LKTEEVFYGPQISQITTPNARLIDKRLWTRLLSKEDRLAQIQEWDDRSPNLLGLSASQAISLFYRQVQLRQGLPFETENLPNNTTALNEAEASAGERKFPYHLSQHVW